jgi:hypothetical protein
MQYFHKINNNDAIFERLIPFVKLDSLREIRAIYLENPQETTTGKIINGAF